MNYVLFKYFNSIINNSALQPIWLGECSRCGSNQPNTTRNNSVRNACALLQTSISRLTNTVLIRLIRNASDFTNVSCIIRSHRLSNLSNGKEKGNSHMRVLFTDLNSINLLKSTWKIINGKWNFNRNGRIPFVRNSSDFESQENPFMPWFNRIADKSWIHDSIKVTSNQLNEKKEKKTSAKSNHSIRDKSK